MTKIVNSHGQIIDTEKVKTEINVLLSHLSATELVRARTEVRKIAGKAKTRKAKEKLKNS